MSGIDIFIAVVFIYNILVGFSNGLLKSLLGLASFILAIILAPAFQGTVKNIISEQFSSPEELTNLLSLGFSWLLIYIILNIISNMIVKSTDKTLIKGFDRFAGVMMGVFMSLMIIIIPILVMESIPVIKEVPRVEKALQKSELLILFKPLASPFENIFKVALKKQRDEIMSKLQERRSELEKKVNKTSKDEEIRKMLKDMNVAPLGTKK